MLLENAERVTSLVADRHELSWRMEALEMLLSSENQRVTVQFNDKHGRQIQAVLEWGDLFFRHVVFSAVLDLKERLAENLSKITELP